MDSFMYGYGADRSVVKSCKGEPGCDDKDILKVKLVLGSFWACGTVLVVVCTC